jgi:hypothetical protein
MDTGCAKFRQLFWTDATVVQFVRQRVLRIYTGTMQVCLIFDTDGQLDHHCPISHIPRLFTTWLQLETESGDMPDDGTYYTYTYKYSPSTVYTIYKIRTESNIPVYVIFANACLYMVVVSTDDLSRLVPLF